MAATLDGTILGSARKSRRKSGRIIAANRYLIGVEKCVGSMCPVLPENWAELVKSAEESLTYSNSDTIVRNILKKSDPKSIDDESASILDFDCVITSTRKDRDGDVLESIGASVDPHCPLLWQHVPAQPIGVLKKLGEHTKTRVCGSFSIAGTQLGRDAAILVELGALRISHGFDATEYEPLSTKDDSGWRVTKFDIVEVSLVSVPSNIDAVITAHEKGILKSGLIKAWAQKKWESRPVMVPGVGPGTLLKTHGDCGCGGHKAAPPTVTVNFYGAKNMAGAVAEAETAEAVTEIPVAVVETPAVVESAASEPENIEPVVAAAEVVATEVVADATTEAVIGDVVVAVATEPAVVATDEPVAKNHLQNGLEKAFVSISTKGYYGGTLKGSYEDLLSDLASTLKTYLSGTAFRMPANSYCYTVATYASEAVFCLNWSAEDSYHSELYRLSWGMVGDEPTWNGEPTKVELEVTVKIVDAKSALVALSKSFAGRELKRLTAIAKPIAEKAGRSLSAANKAKIKEAHDDCSAVIEMSDVPRPAKALCRSAKSNLADMFGDDKPEDDDDEKQSIERLLKLSAGVTQDGAGLIPGTATPETVAGKDSRPRTIKELAKELLELIEPENAAEAAEYGRLIQTIATGSLPDEQVSDEQILNIVGDRFAAALV